MKKIFLTLATVLIGVTQMDAMTNREIRENARFLSDRMAYELNLTPQQYEDCFEINYDFLSAIDDELDGMCYGYESAINSYYDYLDYRNEDLRYVLNNAQYASFYALDYFFRPIYTTAGRWMLRIFDRYSNRSFFYYDAPRIYWDYRGAHARRYYGNGYYGGGRYHHNIYRDPRPIRHHNGFDAHRRNDFGHHHAGPGHHEPSRHHEPARPSHNYGYGRNDRHEPSRHHEPVHRDNGGSHNGFNNNHNNNHNSNHNNNYNHNNNFNSNHNGNMNHNNGGSRPDNRGGAHSGHNGGSRHEGGTRGGGGGHHDGGPRMSTGRR